MLQSLCADCERVEHYFHRKTVCNWKAEKLWKFSRFPSVSLKKHFSSPLALSSLPCVYACGFNVPRIMNGRGTTLWCYSLLVSCNVSCWICDAFKYIQMLVEESASLWLRLIVLVSRWMDGMVEKFLESFVDKKKLKISTWTCSLSFHLGAGRFRSHFLLSP